MIRLSLVLSLFCSLGITTTQCLGQMREPNFAPSQQGIIRSPRVVKPKKSELSPELAKLIDEAIEVSSRRYLIANEHSPWQIYHGLNAFRHEFLVEQDGRLVPAIDWLSANNPQFRGLPWFEKTAHGGRAHKYTQPYHFEGHPNQSLALMVMSNLPREHVFQTDNGPITVQDIINNAKADLNPREELTWTLWFLTHYLESEETWLTRRGQTWSIEKLVADQIQTKVTGSACGGTHNLYALAVARNNHIRRGGQMRGVWIQADQKVKRYMTAARSLQRPDGSFPTSYFRGYGSPKTISEQIASSGHMMEWIVVAASRNELDDPWIEKGISYISQKLIQFRDEPAECGPLYHAVSAVVLYRERMQDKPWPNPEIQETPEPTETDLATTPEPRKLNIEGSFPSQTAELEPEMIAEPADSADVGEQSQNGTLSVELEEDEFREPLENQPVERLASPEKPATR